MTRQEPLRAGEVVNMALGIAKAADSRVDEKADVLALGVLMSELLAETARIPQPLRELVTSCLEAQAFERPCMAEVLGTLEGLEHVERERRRSKRAVTAMVIGTALVTAVTAMSIGWA